MALVDWARTGTTTVINFSMIPETVSKSYRDSLVAYHPTSGLELETIVYGNELGIQTIGDWPLPSRDLMESLRFTEIPDTETTLLFKKVQPPVEFGPWTLHHAAMEKVPGSNGQQILLLWYFPGHEYVYTAWKW